MKSVDAIPGDIADFNSLIEALNERIQDINSDFQGLSSSQNGQTPQLQPATQTDTGAQEGNAFSYSNPDTNVYDFLDPLFASLRTAQIQVSQAQMLANSVGNIQLQVDSVTARVIMAGTITATQIAAETITADKLNVSQLSAISANLGTITAGNITLDTSGFIRGGQTAYNTGTGFWLGYASGVYELSIGSASQALLWNGVNLSITGSISASSGFIGGWTIGSTTITGGNVTLDSAGNVRAGQTAYNTGTGFWLGVVSSVAKFSLGVSSGNFFTWDGTNLLMVGGSSPNNVIIDTTGLSVGLAGAKRVVLGTFSGNAASLNFYNTAGTDLMGMYLAGSVPNIIQAVGNNQVLITTGSGGSTATILINAAFGAIDSLIQATYGTFTTQISAISGFSAQSGVVTMPNGAVGTPAYTFGSDPSGMWLNAAGDLRFSAGGALALVLRRSGTPKTIIEQPLQLENAYVGTPATCTGTVTLLDSGGNVLRVLVANP